MKTTQTSKTQSKPTATVSLTKTKAAKTQVAQCCAKNSAIVAGCHD